MSSRVSISRTVRLPDQSRVARCQRAPELGPRILFFSGGTALRPLSRTLKDYTHNSVHLITPFDSGGSSASLRQAFDMLSIGDLRNRLVALADESSRGNPEMYRLICYRLSKDRSPAQDQSELDSMVDGEHPLVAAVPEPMRQIVQTHLRFFRERAPESFDLRGANIGNLLLTGGYLSQERNLRSTLFLFSKLLEVRGLVIPSAQSTAHLAAKLDNGETVIGQHYLTGKEVAPLKAKIQELYLVQGLHDATSIAVEADAQALKHIRRADLLCFPMGSFYTSIMANLLPAGIGRAVAASGCPKVYVPNMGPDPEARDLPTHEAVARLLAALRQDCEARVDASRLLNMVLVDTANGNYELPINREKIEAQGVRLVDVALREADAQKPGATPQLLTEVLLTLAQ